ncbi:MAG: cytochrome c biogenesis protein CcdA [Rikenellaceae bacterium]
MTRFKSFSMAFIFTITAFLSSISLFAQIENPVSWSASVKDLGNGEYELEIEALVDEPWYIYDMGPYEGGPNATTIEFKETKGLELVGGIEQKSEKYTKFDEMFEMEIGSFKETAIFAQKVKITEPLVTLLGVVEWQSCNDMTCLPPSEYDFQFTLKGASTQAVSNVAEASKSDEKNVAAEVNPENVSEVASKSAENVVIIEKSSSLWATIIEAILWGFAALLTPCVFPMVPMTVSFFMKNSGSKTKGRSMATFYGLSIIALYTLPIAVIIAITYFVGGDAVTADIFNWLATHWVPNVLFFLIFMVFAASFFGAFEIVMPSWLVNKSDEKSDKGGYIGVFFMALTLVLVSFSCTGPIVGSILVQSTQGGVFEPIITMLVFSAAFSLPFTLLAFFPSLLKNLPKSGGWLNSVKVVLGFIELALGLKFLSVADQTYHWGILDRDVYIAIWIVIFILLGLYLLGKLKFAHDSEVKYVKVKNLFLAIISFSFAVYLVPGMFGAPLKALSGYLPPVHTLDFDLTKGSAGVSVEKPKEMVGAKYSDFLHLPHNLNGFFDYEEGMAYAKKVGKPVLLDFTGHGCVNCREMEANVWSDSQVLDILRNDYVIIALYVDDKKELPESEWVEKSNGKVLKTIGKINADFQASQFKVNGQPYYVLLSDDGKELSAPRAYDLSVQGYVDFLNKGVETFNQNK